MNIGLPRGLSAYIPRWSSLQTRITFATLIIFLVGIWSLSIYISTMLRKDIEHLVTEQQRASLALVAADIVDEVGIRTTGLQRIADASAEAMRKGPDDMRAFFAQRPVLQTLFNGGYFACDTDGNAISDYPVGAGRLERNFLTTDAVAAALKIGKPSVGLQARGRPQDPVAIIIAVPIRDGGGAILGVLSGVTDLGAPNFFTHLMESRFGRTGGYRLIDRERRMVISATDRSWIMQPLPAVGVNAIIDRTLDGEEGSAIFVNSQGVEVLASDVLLPVTGWILAAVLPTSEAFAPIRAMQWRMAFATLVLTLLAGVLTWWILRRQLAPLRSAALTMAAMSQQGAPLHSL
ncbi:MAG TPA: cache domain-containing protein, partial [Casimicrobiaceae bacterium]